MKKWVNVGLNLSQVIIQTGATLDTSEAEPRQGLAVVGVKVLLSVMTILASLKGKGRTFYMLPRSSN